VSTSRPKKAERHARESQAGRELRARIAREAEERIQRAVERQQERKRMLDALIKVSRSP
jgi:hypothetical protein